MCADDGEDVGHDDRNAHDFDSVEVEIVMILMTMVMTMTMGMLPLMVSLMIQL